MRHEYSDRVKELYGKYPRKTGCAEVAGKIDRMSDVVYREASQAIDWQSNLFARRAARSPYGWSVVPHFATWINQRGWEAEEVDGFGKPEEVRQNQEDPNIGNRPCKNCGYREMAHTKCEITRKILERDNGGAAICRNFERMSHEEYMAALLRS